VQVAARVLGEVVLSGLGRVRILLEHLADDRT
jgi:hypothetical protein